MRRFSDQPVGRSLVTAVQPVREKCRHDRGYEQAARHAADRILGRCLHDGRLLHREKDGRAWIAGFATDYAFFVEALLDLYEATFDARYFREAVRLQSIFESEFAGAGGAYYLAASGHDGLILRPTEAWDGATPSSNSVAALNLLRLHAFTGEPRYRERAEEVMGAFAAVVEKAPAAFPRLLCALDFASDTPREIVLAGTEGDEAFERLRAAVFASPRLNRVVAHASADGPPELAGLSRGRAEAHPARAFVCESFACRAPVSDPAELTAALDG